jgi:hypothetical protein
MSKIDNWRTTSDIAIALSWPKSLLFLFATLLLAVGSYRIVDSGQAGVGWFGVCLSGLTSLVILLNMVFNRPPLRITADGIVYKGSYGLWMRGWAPWRDIRAIVLAPIGASRRGFPLGGLYDLNVFIEGEHTRRVTIQNWQLPFSARKSLRLAIQRFQQQIDENDIVVQGIE